MPSLQGLSNFILKPKVVETIEMIAKKGQYNFKT